MPKRTAEANAAESAVRAVLAPPFAHQKGPMGLVIRTLALARATAHVMLANMTDDMRRWCWRHRRSLPERPRTARQDRRARQPASPPVSPLTDPLFQK